MGVLEIIPFWLSVLALVVVLSRISNLAGWLLAPYLAWVTFAGWLNWRVVQLNKPFGRRVARGVGERLEAITVSLLDGRAIDAILAFSRSKAWLSWHGAS